MIVLSFDVGIINLAYCIFDSTTCKIIHWEVISLIETTNYSNLYTNLIKELDNRKEILLNIDTVVIEKQPSFNPKMRIIAGCLQTYFFIRGVVDSQSIKNVEIFSPKHKLKCYTGPEIKVTGKSKYTQTKKIGIEIARYKLEEFSESITFKKLFESSKKKDDLADCYLQAIIYCQFKKVLHTELSQKDHTMETFKNKTVIKKIIKELLDSNIQDSNIQDSNIQDSNIQDSNIHELMNNNLLNFMNSLKVNNILQNSIQSKFLIDFPITQTDLEKLFNSLNMKGYLKKNYLISN